MKHLKNISLKVVSLSILYSLGLTISSPAWANESINMSVLFTENSKKLQISKADIRLYNAQALWSNDSFSLLVTTGHEKQQGKIVIDNTSVKAFDKQATLLWEDQRSEQKVCLPELFGEFIRAHLQELKNGKSIKCVGPIIKAKKLAPFKVYLEEQSENELLIKIGPGSISMWFFMNDISIRMNASGTKVLAYDGLSPAPKTLNGKMAYLNVSTELTPPLNVAKVEKTILW